MSVLWASVHQESLYPDMMSFLWSLYLEAAAEFTSPNVLFCLTNSPKIDYWVCIVCHLILYSHFYYKWILSLYLICGLFVLFHCFSLFTVTVFISPFSYPPLLIIFFFKWLRQSCRWDHPISQISLALTRYHVQRLHSAFFCPWCFHFLSVTFIKNLFCDWWAWILFNV